MVITQPIRMPSPSKKFQQSPAEPAELFSFPRRFDLASMMAISVGYAMLFAAMRLFDASPYLMFSTGGLIAAVGVSQAMLFSGEEPRKASLIIGGVYCLIAVGIAAALYAHPAEVAAACVFAIMWGPLAGYLAGALVGGVFLIAEYGRRGMTKFKQPTEPVNVSSSSADDGAFSTKNDC